MATAKQSTPTPVNCPVCGKTISRKTDLARHMKLHMPDSEQRKIPCPYEGCRYRTHQRSNLTTHLNVHTRERPHKCLREGCQFRTGDRGSLSRHVREVHERQPRGGSGRAGRTRKTTRRQQRMSPYPSSPSLANDQVVQDGKITSAAYSTQSITERVHVNDPQLSQPENVPSVTSGPRLSTASEPPVAEHAKLLIQDLHTFDTAAPSLSQMTANGWLFGKFDAPGQFDDWSPNAAPRYTGPSLTTLLDQYATNDTSSSASASLFPETYPIIPASPPVSSLLPALYTPNNSFTPTSPSLFPDAPNMPRAADKLPAPQLAPWPLPVYDPRPAVNNSSSLYGYAGYATEPSLAAQFDSWNNSLAKTDTVVGVHSQPQAVCPRGAVNFDQSRSYANIPGTAYRGGETSGGLRVQGLCA